MKDKTIIDGVEASGCECFEKFDGTLDEFDVCLDNLDKCKFYSNCYYKQLKRKEAEYEKWKSYYDLYRQNEKMLKKIQGVINSHPEYGVELTKTGIIDKDERISSLDTDEQIKLIFTEYEAELQTEKDKVKELEEKYKWYEHYKSSALYNKDLCNKKSDEIKKYKQALKEIREIALSTLDCGEWIGQGDNKIEAILKKCEAIGNE